MSTLSNQQTRVAYETVADGFGFCEAPRVGEDGAVWFSDLTGGGYYRVKPGARPETMLPDRIWIGGATLDQGDAFVCGGKGGLVLVEGGTPRPLLSEIAGVPVVAVNDIEADEAGGIFGGTLDFAAVFERGEVPSGGIFFHLSTDGAVTVLRDDVVASNGIGFSPDGRTLYHSESTVGVWAWDRDVRGMPTERRLLAPLDDCDGLAVDVEGGIWVACWQSARVLRLQPDGTEDRRIDLPLPHIVSMAFGGADMRELYLATGGNAEHPEAGGVIRLHVDVPGLPAHRSRFARRTA